jgi:anaphase-promoting complex subunit 3
MDSLDSGVLLPVVAQRFQTLIWAFLDSDLTRTAVFYAERYFALDQQSHDARHLYATSLLREGQIHPALCVVNISRQDQCSGCLELEAKCCNMLGRYRQARRALEDAAKEIANMPSTSARAAHQSPDPAAIHCRSGSMALKGSLQNVAAQSFRQALALNPFLWEAFEGLCVLASIPEIDELFPPFPDPVKHSVDGLTSKPSGPMASGAGFFTPEANNAGNLFRGFKLDAPQLQPFRISPPAELRDSLASSDSPFRFADTTFQQAHRSSRSQPAVSGSTQQHITRPLSSADEAGPLPKKLRSIAPQHSLKPSKPLKLPIEDPLKKPSATSRAVPPATKTAGANVTTRRSTRLLSGTGSKHASKVSTRERRKPHGHARSRSIESDEDDGEVANSPSPPAMAQSPRSEGSPSPWSLSQEQVAQAAYETEVADKYIYDLMRQFARVTRALSMYQSQRCLEEIELLPHIQQKTPWVLSMVGKAHYNKGDYISAERAFKAVRTLEPYRLWDMEVYSTLLWHLQRSVELSFLAQELLNLDPRSPQAWIAIGNLFSLQKERAQALTCFRRATQMDSSCAYAYTLSGHETIDEDLDKAVTFFQSALRVDPRHYNAWYGLGTCYLRMSKLRLAEYHFRKAVEIHPKNAVLLGCVGMVRLFHHLSDFFYCAEAPVRWLSVEEIEKERALFSTKLLSYRLRTRWCVIAGLKSLSLRRSTK